jgi:predicted glutamine amidotransferase
MCGFVIVKRKDGRPAYKSVLKRYRAQKQRGTEGYGYVAIENNQIVSYQRAQTEHEIINLISKEKASEIFFHHRNPTGTPNMTELAHPFLVENAMLDHQYFVGHNGTIRNTAALKEEHEKLGIDYTSEMLKAFVTKQGEQYITGTAWNDSESIAIETALTLDGKKAFIDIEGPAAVYGLQTKGKKVISRFFFRNNLNPLKFHEDKVMVTITSMGEGAVVPAEKLYQLSEKNGYEVISHKFPPFLSYKPTPHHSIATRDGYWDSVKKEWVKHDTTMGFLRDGMVPRPKIVQELLDNVGIPRGEREDDIDYGPPDDRSDHDLDWETNALLSDMGMNELWAEYDLSIGRTKDLKLEIAKIDAQTSYTSTDINNREKLQHQLDERDKWEEMVMDEIQARNTLDDRMYK